MKYHIITYGCQMNKSDSERIAGLLLDMGWKEAQCPDEADLIIINTCSVRQSAEDRVFGQARQLAKLKARRLAQGLSPLIIGVTGCLPGRDKNGRLKAKLPEADLWFPIKDLPKLPRLFQEHFLKSRGFCATAQKLRLASPTNLHLITPNYQTKFSAFVPVQTGCNQYCAYCVVPYARGTECSRPIKDILTEIKKLAARGCLEITLLGQTINNYQAPDPQNFSAKNPYLNSPSPCPGLDGLTTSPRPSRRLEAKQLASISASTPLPVGARTSSLSPLPSGERTKVRGINSFAALLWEINQIPKITLIDFTAPHPIYMTDEVINALTLPKQANYLHLPVQCGDNKVLAQMNRKYTREYYFKIIKKIRAKKPNIALGTDIIVGFPGETKAQFEKTVDLYKRASFDIAYLAMYSERSGTLAAKKFKDSVSRQEKKRRWQVLQDLMEKTTLKKNQKYVGKIIEVIVDKKLTTFNLQLSTYVGHSREMKRVRFEIPFIPPLKKGKKSPLHPPFQKWNRGGFIGKIVKVKIDKALTWELRGEFVRMS